MLAGSGPSKPNKHVTFVISRKRFDLERGFGNKDVGVCPISQIKWKHVELERSRSGSLQRFDGVSMDGQKIPGISYKGTYYSIAALREYLSRLRSENQSLKWPHDTCLIDSDTEKEVYKDQSFRERVRHLYMLGDGFEGFTDREREFANIYRCQLFRKTPNINPNIVRHLVLRGVMLERRAHTVAVSLGNHVNSPVIRRALMISLPILVLTQIHLIHMVKMEKDDYEENLIRWLSCGFGLNFGYAIHQLALRLPPQPVKEVLTRTLGVAILLAVMPENMYWMLFGLSALSCVLNKESAVIIAEKTLGQNPGE